jgi:opacity protein-like surface antigen
MEERMRKGLLITLVIVCCGVYAVAQQDYHKAEVFGGWNYYHFDVGAGTTNGASNSSSDGINVDGTYYFKKYLGFTADLQWNKKTFPAGTITPNTADTTEWGLAFGPRFKGHFGRVEPFGDVLLGFNRIGATEHGFPTESDTAFAMKVGGGVDVGVAKHFAIRVGEFSYYMTRYANAGNQDIHLNGKGTQNNLTFATGIVIR